MSELHEDDLDARNMRVAIDEARKGTPSPNPHVGAVLTDPRTGEIVGRGFHRRPGEDHAELAAIRDAGERARGATLYVTLEPCNHHGRTPPCTDAVLAAGIGRVVVGVDDPNPHVTGRGNARLRAAGIDVREGVLADACARIVAPFAKHVREGRPFVRLKLATSLDGRIAAAPHPSRPDAPRGVSRWITSEGSRARVHALRAAADAVAIGIGTALADDPELTVRDAPRVVERDLPRRIVFDAKARLPSGARLVSTARSTQTIVVAADDADPANVERLQGHGVHVIRVPRRNDEIDLDAALLALGKEGVVDLLVEGGARLAGSLARDGFVDELIWFLAPIMLGAQGRPALEGPSPITPDDAPRYRIVANERIGHDVMLTLHPR